MKNNIFILISIIPILSAGCPEKSDTTTDTVTSATGYSDDYQTDELTEYEGIELGSVNHFRENSISGAPSVNLDDYSLSLDGLVDTPAEYTYSELQNLTHEKRVITIYCVEGWEVTVLWEGIPLRVLFESAGVLDTADTAIFHAADGYTTSVELSHIIDNDLMIADKANGLVLPERLGFPYILVAEEKWGYKWARWITRIELSDESDYKGYWESRGYNQDADLSGPIRD